MLPGLPMQRVQSGGLLHFGSKELTIWDCVVTVIVLLWLQITTE